MCAENAREHGAISLYGAVLSLFLHKYRCSLADSSRISHLSAELEIGSHFTTGTAFAKIGAGCNEPIRVDDCFFR